MRAHVECYTRRAPRAACAVPVSSQTSPMMASLIGQTMNYSYLGRSQYADTLFSGAIAGAPSCNACGGISTSRQHAVLCEALHKVKIAQGQMRARELRMTAPRARTDATSER